MALNRDSIYSNQGNPSVLRFIGENDRKVLDVGCGSGDTAQLIRSIHSNINITGITCSQAEFEKAVQRLDFCFCVDIEQDPFPIFPHKQYDAIYLAHILEHLVDPVAVVRKLLPYLKVGGKLIMVVPNVMNWRNRWKLLLGKFEYAESGIMDKTHLHFYTFHTAARYLMDPFPELQLETYAVNGNVPLAFFRHHVLNDSIRQRLDKFGCHLLPNLFGSEILMKATKRLSQTGP